MSSRTYIEAVAASRQRRFVQAKRAEADRFRGKLREATTPHDKEDFRSYLRNCSAGFLRDFLAKPLHPKEWTDCKDCGRRCACYHGPAFLFLRPWIPDRCDPCDRVFFDWLDKLYLED